MPETYRSQHAGSIADLIRQRGQIDAHAVSSSGDLAAQARMASGQAWGNAIAGIGQMAAGTLRDYANYREDAPNRALRDAQTKRLTAELSSMETAAAQSKIGELAQMVKASGYDPSTAEPLFRAIGELSPEYAQPLMRSLMEPALLKNVTDTLITQTPGYKAPEGFTLGPEQVRYDATGKEIASGPPKPVPPAQPYTLTPGSERRGPNNELLASVPANTPQAANPTEASLALLAAKGDKEAEAALKFLRDQRPKPTGGSDTPRPLTQTAEAQIIQRLANQWTTANKPIKELERQVQLMDAGMEAVNRGDLAQGAQMVLVTFQKILDPPSVVRESEFMRSAAGQSLINRVKGAVERLTKGGAGITAPELQKFATLAREAATAQRKASGVDSVKKRLGMTADRYNIPQELIFEDVEIPETTPAPTTPGRTDYLSNDPNWATPVAPKKPGGR